MFGDLSPDGRREMSLALMDLLRELWGAEYAFISLHRGNTNMIEQSNGAFTEYEAFTTRTLVSRNEYGCIQNEISLHVQRETSEVLA